MTPDARQQAANALYANLMEEIKFRIAWINQALHGGLGIPDAPIREFCFLQQRMICETIALACLTAHGDLRRTAKLSKEFSADRIINMLSVLHPDFYPYPVRIEVNNITNNVTLHEISEPYLTKRELPILYNRCADFLHRGTERKLLSARSPQQMAIVPKRDFDEIAMWTNKIIHLLNNHRISSLDRTRHLIVALKNMDDGDRIMVALALSPPQT